MTARWAALPTLGAAAALALIACGDSDTDAAESERAGETDASSSSSDETAKGEGAAAEGAAQARERAVLPDGALAAFSASLDRALARDALLCPGYAAPAKTALRELLEGARGAGGASEDGGDAARAFAETARAAADGLAELSPERPEAARRHTELAAAVTDLADGFSALADRADRGSAIDQGEIDRARARTKNGLKNAGAAAGAVLRACDT